MTGASTPKIKTVTWACCELSLDKWMALIKAQAACSAMFYELCSGITLKLSPLLRQVPYRLKTIACVLKLRPPFFSMAG